MCRGRIARFFSVVRVLELLYCSDNEGSINRWSTRRTKMEIVSGHRQTRGATESLVPPLLQIVLRPHRIFRPHVRPPQDHECVKALLESARLPIYDALYTK